METTRIRFKHGFYKLRGTETSVAGIDFDLVKEYSVGVRGGYVTVDGTNTPGFPDRNIKVMVEDEDCYELVEEIKEREEETDEQIVERMRRKFYMLDELTKATRRGDIRSLIVSGPPGVGKSHGVEAALAEHDTLVALGGDTFKKYEFVKGTVSPLGLYCKLYDFAAKDNVLVFDDCDAVFDDVLALNILKAALDSKQRRTISWNTDSHKLRREGIPDSFTFRGSVVFITNIKFADVRSKKLKGHIEALESRSHYVDLSIDTTREKMLRIKQVIADGMLDPYGFDGNQLEDILDYVDANKMKLRELSLRSVIKAAELYKAFPSHWQDMADTTLMG